MKLHAPGGERTFLVIAHLAITGILLHRGWEMRSGWVFVAGGLGLALCGGLWFLKPWARWGATGFWISISLVSAYAANSWLRLPGIMGLLVGAWRIWHAFAPSAVARHLSRSAEDSDRPPMTSLVLLLRRTRSLNARFVAEYVSSAWGGHYEHYDNQSAPPESPTGNTDGSPPRFVVGNTPSFLVSSPHGVFLVNCFDQPYFEDPESLANAVGESRLRHMLEENRAWLSVDLMKTLREDVDRKAAYAPIARLVGELSGADCIALLCPETNQWLPWNHDLEEKLKGPNPLDLFDTEASLPVVEIPEDDPRLQAAAAEARQRWPEFIDAFGRRTGAETEHFAIKAPVTSGDRTEFIWVVVESIQGESIRGKLGNDPVDLGLLKLGSPVEVKVDEVQDWAYVLDAEPVGMFSVKVIQEIQKEREDAELEKQP